jgi:hypothetical protein
MYRDYYEPDDSWQVPPGKTINIMYIYIFIFNYDKKISALKT